MGDTGFFLNLIKKIKTIFIYGKFVCSSENEMLLLFVKHGQLGNLNAIYMSYDIQDGKLLIHLLRIYIQGHIHPYLVDK